MRQMNFTKSELEMLYQYAAPTKEETLAGLKEIVPVLERKDDLLSKVIVENTIRKLEKLAEPECSRFIADNRAAFIEKRDNSIRQRLAAAKARKGEPVLQGHDLAGMERFLPETRHMVTVDILNGDRQQDQITVKNQQEKVKTEIRQLENRHMTAAHLWWIEKQL